MKRSRPKWIKEAVTSITQDLQNRPGFSLLLETWSDEIKVDTFRTWCRLVEQNVPKSKGLCPFCGIEPVIDIRSQSMGHGEVATVLQYWCKGCGTRGPTKTPGMDGTRQECLDQLDKHWNQRHG